MVLVTAPWPAPRRCARIIAGALKRADDTQRADPEIGGHACRSGRRRVWWRREHQDQPGRGENPAGDEPGGRDRTDRMVAVDVRLLAVRFAFGRQRRMLPDGDASGDGARRETEPASHDAHPAGWSLPASMARRRATIGLRAARSGDQAA